MDLKTTNEKEQFNFYKNNPYRLPAQQSSEKASPYMIEYMKFMEDIMSGAGPAFFNSSNPHKGSLEEEQISLGTSSKEGEQIEQIIQSLKTDDESKEYLLKLGARESGFDPKAQASGSSYRGLYQFNNDSLKTIGINPKKYDTDIITQFEAALKYKDHNLKLLKPYHKYIGDEFKGIKITANGMAAAAHLLGAATVTDWFDDTRNSEFAKNGFKDGNGTSITEYFRMFEPKRS